MTFLNQLLEQPQAQASSPASMESVLTSIGWGNSSATGMPVSMETAMKISAVWACAGLISDCVAMLPAVVLERMPDGSRQRAENHPLYDLLHDQPNNNQTAFEFKSQLTLYMLIRGAGRARIVPGARGFADKLVPIHPDYVHAERIQGGGIRYQVSDPNVGAGTYNDEDILDIKGPAFDDVNPMSVVSYARESLGLALAGERVGAKNYANGNRMSGLLKHPGKFKDDKAQKRVKESWQEANAGIERSGGIAILEEGMDFVSLSMNNRDQQWLESREFQAEDICRWFRVPPHMVGLTSKATSWGSGIEEMGMGFVTYTLEPWLQRWSQAIRRDLILATRKYFVEFIVDALLRGRTLDRYNVYRIASEIGVMSPNDIRRLENMNPRRDPGGDAYSRPLNMQPSNAAPGGDAHYDQLLVESAGRVVRKEVAAISRAARRDNAEAIVAGFYADHAEFVSEALRIPSDLAQRYVEEQLAELAARGPGAISDWETRRVADLVALVKESR